MGGEGPSRLANGSAWLRATRSWPAQLPAFLPTTTVSNGPALQTTNFLLEGLLGEEGRGRSSVQGPEAVPGTARP